ncbi:flavin-containing monooxygenase [Glycomyces algeriensis]|uniref:Monooxygenase n=1 Tax=Glycomyces algeriensis TaxID=256037 RepID=A0A9W6GE14_9ACTN|nr:NAD(P)-binding domain-containing protein [Glycomyces algeriensis]MDA1369110.1 NAD(P)-binding domain-containing protein [Glycomyces algeriensis]MDR7352436.1 putative flavoprotein involved in K+ transport [Glycomyces algeriensis]GLI45176.1 monooxygenase [Glycomyces algeriensis]
MDLIDTLVIGAGQSGLATAHTLRKHGIDPIVLEAGDAPTGAWPKYYQSLTLFSPARYSALPGMPFPGDPDRYPHRDEVIDYLAAYAKELDADIRTGHHVRDLEHANGIFTARLADGRAFHARTVVAATGGFTNPYRPALPGLEGFNGRVMHAADYQRPEPFAGQRVLVIGGGNSAVQIATELAEHAHVTVTTRGRLRFAPQRPFGRDLHFWYTVTGLDAAPVGRFLAHPPTVPVLDTGRYREALAAGRPEHRPMFTTLEADQVIWSDGTSEHVDALILATGYRPALDYLTALDVVDAEGHPRHRGGLSTDVPGLGFVGLEWQRSLSSASIRGVGRDAARVVRSLASLVLNSRKEIG